MKTIDKVIDEDKWVDYKPKTKLGREFMEFASDNLPGHMPRFDWNLPWVVCLTQALEVMVKRGGEK